MREFLASNWRLAEKRHAIQCRNSFRQTPGRIGTPRVSLALTTSRTVHREYLHASATCQAQSQDDRCGCCCCMRNSRSTTMGQVPAGRVKTHEVPAGTARNV